ncbi:MAG TPA: MscL family protein [Candidatus Saccharibacteria bacterium]|nr:MscL family protein [Candidatus Saccharibacteria bacterium]
MEKARSIKPLAGFVEFIREQGVIGLAIGLVIGTAVKSLVDSLVANIVNPIIGLVLGGVDLSHKSLCIRNVDGACTTYLTWGSFVSSLISFVTIAAVIYFVFKGLRLDKLDIDKDLKKGMTKGTAGAASKLAKK